MKPRTEKVIPPTQHIVISSSTAGEIGLQDIVYDLKKQWKQLVAITFIVTLCALLVALVMPKVYRAEVVLLPPGSSDIELLNIPDIFELTADDMFGNFVMNLNSNSLRFQFFTKFNLFDQLVDEGTDNEEAYVVFQEKFSEMMNVWVEEGRNGTLGKVNATFEGKSPQLTSELLNGYIKFADEFTVKSVVNTIKARVKIQESVLNERISGLRIVAKDQRKNELERILEALQIAESIGMEDPVPISFDTTKNVHPESDDKQSAKQVEEVTRQDYFKGSKALRAEAAAIKSRKHDDPFIPGLRSLQEELVILQQINIVDKDVHSIRFDQIARAEDKPVKPNRLLIIVLGFVFGVIVAFLLALVRIFQVQ